MADYENSKALVALVMQRLDITTHEDLGVMSGMVPPRQRGDRPQRETNKLKKIAGWVDGKTRPSFEPLMGMLSAAGLLAPEALAIFPPTEDAAQQLAKSRSVLDGEQSRTGRRRRTQDDPGKAA